MSDDTKKLVNGLRERAEHAATEGNMTATCDARYFTRAADALEALAGEVEDLKSFFVGVEGPKLVKQMRGEVANLTAERDRLKDAIRLIASYGDGAGCNPASFTEIAREALENKE